MKLKKIRALCKAHGINIVKLETAVGLANGTICKWDGKNPSVGNVKRVADYFGVTVDELLKE